MLSTAWVDYKRALAECSKTLLPHFEGQKASQAAAPTRFALGLLELAARYGYLGTYLVDALEIEEVRKAAYRNADDGYAYNPAGPRGIDKVYAKANPLKRAVLKVIAALADVKVNAVAPPKLPPQLAVVYVTGRQVDVLLPFGTRLLATVAHRLITKALASNVPAFLAVLAAPAALVISAGFSLAAAAGALVAMPFDSQRAKAVFLCALKLLAYVLKAFLYYASALPRGLISLLGALLKVFVEAMAETKEGVNKLKAEQAKKEGAGDAVKSVVNALRRTLKRIVSNRWVQALVLAVAIFIFLDWLVDAFAGAATGAVMVQSGKTPDDEGFWQKASELFDRALVAAKTLLSKVGLA